MYSECFLNKLRKLLFGISLWKEISWNILTASARRNVNLAFVFAAKQTSLYGKYWSQNGACCSQSKTIFPLWDTCGYKNLALSKKQGPSQHLNTEEKQNVSVKKPSL